MATIVQPAVGDLATSAWADSVASALGDSGWVQPTLGGSWVSYDGGTTYDIPAYRVMNGVVYLKGLMKSGTTGSTIFTLPAGARPLKSRAFVVITAATAAAELVITAAGAVIVQAYTTGGTNGFVSLEVSFIQEQ